LLGISFCTDAFDGYLARKYKTTSIFGAKLDFVADDFTVIAAIIGIILFRPGFLVQEGNIIILLLSLFLLQNICAFARYKRMSNFHTYTAKVAAVARGIFLVLFFFVPNLVIHCSISPLLQQ
jgi:CDP-diacylglycerol--glycerol-3-phosphate 3-phosphatidyltransferase